MATTKTRTEKTRASMVWFFYAFTRATRGAIAGVYACAFGVVIWETNRRGLGWASDDGGGDGDAVVNALGGFMCAYALTFYALLWNQSCVALEALREARRGASDADAPTLFDIKYGARKTPAYVTAERSVGNFIEQSVALLPALFYHVFATGRREGVRVAYAWLVVRWLYPWSFARGFGWFTNLQTPVFLFVTFPNYVAIGVLYRDIARHAGLLY